MTKRVTSTELRTWKRCRRKWWLSTFRALRLKREEPVGPAALGNRVHASLAVLYDPTDERDPLAVLEEGIAVDLEANPDRREKIEKEADLARAMVEGYVEWLADTGADEDLEIVAAETALEVPLDVHAPLGNVTLLGKLDLRVRRISDGARLFLDHKTVQSFDERVRLLHLDEQMKFYHLLEYLSLLNNYNDPNAVDGRTDGALYNMIRKVKRTARAKPPFYAREEVRHNVHVLRSFWTQVVGEIVRIMEAEAALRAGADHRTIVPPTPTRDCAWDCPFLPVCPMLDDESAGAEHVIHSYYEAGDPLARYTEGESDE